MSNKQIYEALNIARESVFNEIGKTIASRVEGETFTLGKLQGLMTAHLILQDMLKAVNKNYTGGWEDLEKQLRVAAERRV